MHCSGTKLKDAYELKENHNCKTFITDKTNVSHNSTIYKYKNLQEKGKKGSSCCFLLISRHFSAL